MSKKRQQAQYYPHSLPGAQAVTLSYDFEHDEHQDDHYHDEDQLVFACKGVMTVQTNEGVWIVPPLRAVWIPGKIVHSIRMSGTVSMRTLYFAKNYVKGLPQECFVMNVSSLLRELILHACEEPHLSLKIAKQRRLLDMIVDQLDSRNFTPLQLPIPSDERARRFSDILIADPSDGRRLEEICEQCGASKRTIERLFVEQTAMTVGKWRQQLRMLCSIQMLAAGDKVINVALDAGYNSPSAFVSAFHKAMGTTPSHYFDA